MTDFGARVDGTQKGSGFFGPVPWKGPGDQPDMVSTELSVDVDVDGQKIFLPLLVPTLDRAEVDYLLSGKPATDAIYNKAIEHALARIKAGKSPFAEEGEQGPLPKSPDEYMQEGFQE